MRRDVHLSAGLGAGVCCMVLMGLLAAREAGGVVEAGGSPRIDRTIDAGWKFLRDDAAGAAAVDFNDSTWQTVDLPHSWNVDDGGSANYYRGPGWYRLHLNIGDDLAGKRLYLRFGAASLAAEVFVNGKSAGVHKGGFAAFCFDVSSLLHAGDNVVAVRVTNALDRDLSPLSGDFTVYGGLYREVHLLALDPVSISPIDDASPGVYLKTTVGATSADVEITTKLLNGIKLGEAVTVTCTILDAQGATVGQTTINQTIPAAGSADAVGKITIDRPHLWNGRLDPYLYRVVVEVRRDKTLADRVEQPLGFRTFKVDPDNGLILNGKPYDMHGVDLHQGRPSVGWASTAAMIEQDYAMVADLGCTGVRMAHYQHGDYEHAQCDRLGIIVWSELALVNKMTDTPAFRDNIKQQLREMIKQAGNHPSIFFWSMYNEPAVNAQSGTQEQWRLVQDLVAEAHQLDPPRITTGADAAGVSGPILWYMDTTGMNRYFGWYSGQINDWDRQLTLLHTQNPGKSIGISEYGAGASVIQHETHPVQPTPKSNWHPEEWQALVHEGAWQAMQDKPWIWCKLAWVMFDFGSAGRVEGDRPGINDKGLVAADHATQKDAYFYYKACWTSEPFVHITDGRFNPRPAGACDIKVYSNCDSVELWLNGKSLGVKANPSHIFIWPAVNLADGKAAVWATGSRGGKTATDAISWTVSATMKETIHPALAAPAR